MMGNQQTVLKNFGILSMVILGWLLLPVRAEAASVSVTASLIHATNQAGEVDGRLKAIEPLLRRQFKFQKYAQLGAGSTSVGLPGSGEIGLPDGFKLVVGAEDGGEGHVRLKVTWSQGDQKIIQTTLLASRGSPVLLGGASHKGGTAIVAITVK